MEPELQSRPVSSVWPLEPSSLGLRLKPMRLQALMADAAPVTAYRYGYDDGYYARPVYRERRVVRYYEEPRPVYRPRRSSEPMTTAMTDPTMGRAIMAAGR